MTTPKDIEGGMQRAMGRVLAVRRWAPLCALVLAALASGCVSEQQKIGAIQDVNEVFRADYERILVEDGRHSYAVPRGQAFAAMRLAFARLGMLLENQSPDLGYLSVYAPAPRPITDAQWREAAQADLPKMHAVLSKRLGLLAYLVPFEPQGLDIVINATAIETHGVTAISLTMRMREVEPPKTGYPRREYAPPTAVRMGLRTIWAAIEQELPPGSRRM